MNLSEQIKKIIAEEVELEPEQIEDNMTMEDLGMDSLSMASVLAMIEELGYEVDSEKIFDSEEEYTVGSLIGKITSNLS